MLPRVDSRYGRVVVRGFESFVTPRWDAIASVVPHTVPGIVARHEWETRTQAELQDVAHRWGVPIDALPVRKHWVGLLPDVGQDLHVALGRGDGESDGFRSIHESWARCLGTLHGHGIIGNDSHDANFALDEDGRVWRLDLDTSLIWWAAFRFNPAFDAGAFDEDHVLKERDFRKGVAVEVGYLERRCSGSLLQRVRDEYQKAFTEAGTAWWPATGQATSLLSRVSKAVEATDASDLLELAGDPDADVREAVARNVQLPAEALSLLCRDAHEPVRRAIVQHPSIRAEDLRLLGEDNSDRVAIRIAAARTCPSDVLKILAARPGAPQELLYLIAGNRNTLSEVLGELGRVEADIVRERIAENRATPDAVLNELLDDSNPDVQQAARWTLGIDDPFGRVVRPK